MTLRNKNSLRRKCNPRKEDLVPTPTRLRVTRQSALAGTPFPSYKQTNPGRPIPLLSTIAASLTAPDPKKIAKLKAELAKAKNRSLSLHFAFSHHILSFVLIHFALF